MDHHYSNINTNPPNTYYQSTQNPNDPFNVTFKNQYSNSIQTNLNIDFDEDNLKYITLNTDDNSFVNCAVQTSVPWFSMSEDYKKCEVVKNIEYDENRLKIEKIKDDTIITPVLSSKNKNKTAFCAYYSNVNKAYCENAWYDWMITPNYHLGNTYYKDNSQYSELDVYKCYKPCSGDYLPFMTEKGEIKCIPKKYFGSGIFSKKYMFNSVALINLIGNIASYTNNDGYEYNNSYRTNLLYILHRLIYEYEITTTVDNNIYDIYKDIEDKITLEPLTSDENSTEDKKYNKKKEYFLKIKSQYDGIYENIKNVLNDDVLKNFDENDNKDYLNLNEFTYKNGRFHENEPEMFSYVGMETQGILTPPILIHTWMLSQIFKPLERDLFNNRDVFYGLNGEEGDKNNIVKIKNETIYFKLNILFNNKHKAIRLKNIFYKAITNCYDGKSAFSVNFISATKKALNNSELVNIIKNNYLYYFTHNINFVKSSIPIPIPNKSDTTTDSKTKLNIHNNFNYSIKIDLTPTLIHTNDNIKNNFTNLLICNDDNIKKLLLSLKYYKDTDIISLYSELLDNINNKSITKDKQAIDKISYDFSLMYFEPPINFNNDNYKNNIPSDLYCHYLFSAEELEIKTCQTGYIYNPNVKECELIAMTLPPPPEEKSLIDDEDVNIPDLSNIMRIFFQIIVVAVILYLIYIIYDLFGEFILSTINYILVNFTHFKQEAGFKLMDLFSGTNISDKLDTESKKLNSRINLAKAELENVIRKDKLASQYNKEVEYKEIQKAKANASK
jgi:hypothetical protein